MLADVLAFHDFLQQSLLVLVERAEPIEGTSIVRACTLSEQHLASLVKLRTSDKAHVHLQACRIIDIVRTVALRQLHTRCNGQARIDIDCRSRREQVSQHILHHLSLLLLTRYNLATLFSDAEDGIGHKLVFTFHLLQGKSVSISNLVYQVTHTVAVERIIHLIVEQGTDVVERKVEVVKQLHHSDGLADTHRQGIACIDTDSLVGSHHNFLSRVFLHVGAKHIIEIFRTSQLSDGGISKMIIHQDVSYQADDRTQTDTTCTTCQLLKERQQDVNMDWQERIEVGKVLFRQHLVIDAALLHRKMRVILQYALVL